MFILYHFFLQNNFFKPAKIHTDILPDQHLAIHKAQAETIPCSSLLPLRWIFLIFFYFLAFLVDVIFLVIYPSVNVKWNVALYLFFMNIFWGCTCSKLYQFSAGWKNILGWKFDQLQIILMFFGYFLMFSSLEIVDVSYKRLCGVPPLFPPYCLFVSV